MTPLDQITAGLSRRCFNCRHHSIPSNTPVCSRFEVVASFYSKYEAARAPCEWARHRDGRCGWAGIFFEPREAAHAAD